MKNGCMSACGLLAAVAGFANAQPVIDGSLAGDTAFYGPIKWSQNTPTGFGDNVAVSGCSNAQVGAPAAATTGIEISIPLTSLGNASGAIRVTAFINGGGHDAVSNQILPGLPASTVAVLGDPRDVDFNDYAGNQFVTATAGTGASPVVDGTAGSDYGAPLALQTNRTNFGDNTNTSGSTCNGSELNAIHTRIADGKLFIMLTGNMESNFTKLELFIDTDVSTGFNNLGVGTVFQDVDFNALARLQGDDDQPGLTFDTGFTADYYVTFGCGGDAPNVTHYPNLANLNTGSGEGYLGSALTGSGSGVLSGGNNPNGIEIAINNANVTGVDAICPPAQGDVDIATGSELDGIYSYLDTANGFLYVLFTGNLQTNFNNLDMFFDVNPLDGQNVLRGNNVDIDFNGLNNMGNRNGNPGLTFDAGFTADYWLSYRTGNGPVVFGNAAVLRANGPLADFSGNHLDYGAYRGGPKPANNPTNFNGPRLDSQDGFTPQIFTEFAPGLSGDSLLIDPLAPVGVANAIFLSLNNSNVAGVSGSSAAGSELVTTGVEVKIDLDELNWDGTTCIRVSAMVLSSNHQFMSNQVSGGLPAGSGNLGTTALVNFNTLAGNQFVELCTGGGPACASDLTACRADQDGDEDIDSDDINIFFSNFEGGDSCGDQDGDDDVDSDDINIFFGRFEAGGC